MLGFAGRHKCTWCSTAVTVTGLGCVCGCRDSGEAHLVVEVVKQPEHAMLIFRVSFIDVLQQLDFIQTLIKVVLVVLQQTRWRLQQPLRYHDQISSRRTDRQDIIYSRITTFCSDTAQTPCCSLLSSAEIRPYKTPVLVRLHQSGCFTCKGL